MPVCAASSARSYWVLSGRCWSRSSLASLNPDLTSIASAIVKGAEALTRELVAVFRHRHFEGVGNAGQHREIIRDRNKLDHPLHAIFGQEPVEDRIIDSIC